LKEILMANQKQASNRRLKMSERAQKQMELYFPGYDSRNLWRRSTNDGYTTMPRTMPLVMQAIDAYSKGQPAGHVLCCLWVRAPDHPLVTIESPATFASEAGFDGERTVDTWRRRMKTLRKLHFIDAKPGPSGDFHYVLLLNPNVAMRYMRRDGLIQDGLWGRFVDRLAEVGGYGEIEVIEAAWAQEKAAAEAAAALAQAQATAATAVPAAAPATGPAAQA